MASRTRVGLAGQRRTNIITRFVIKRSDGCLRRGWRCDRYRRRSIAPWLETPTARCNCCFGSRVHNQPRRSRQSVSEGIGREALPAVDTNPLSLDKVKLAGSWVANSHELPLCSVNRPLYAFVGHEPHQCYQHIDRVGNSGVNECQRDPC